MVFSFSSHNSEFDDDEDDDEENDLDDDDVFRQVNLDPDAFLQEMGRAFGRFIPKDVCILSCG